MTRRKSRARPPVKAATDANQAPIVAALKSQGFTVEFLNVGRGIPDLLVGGIHRETFLPMNILMEVKTARGRLNPKQVEWHANCTLLRAALM